MPTCREAEKRSFSY